MDIGLVYSEKDPQQTEARDFLREFVAQCGVTATIVETQRKVASLTLVINGHTLQDQRRTPRQKDAPMFPGITDIAAALERHLWCL